MCLLVRIIYIVKIIAFLKFISGAIPIKIPTDFFFKKDLTN